MGAAPHRLRALYGRKGDDSISDFSAQGDDMGEMGEGWHQPGPSLGRGSGPAATASLCEDAFDRGRDLKYGPDPLRGS
jgi:hypothetical protein